MSENKENIANKVGVQASNSQVRIQNVYVGSASKPESFSQNIVDWKTVCRNMLADRFFLTSNRLMSSPDTHRDIDLFVDLALVQQKKADKREQDVLPEHGSKLYEPSRYSESERFEFTQFLEEVLSVQKNEKLTIVGEPGSGKTTLLQKIAFWLLDNTDDLVVWISLGKLKSKSLVEYITNDWLNEALMQCSAEALEEWEQQFLKRRVWVLLDGLDEMTPETRDSLSIKGWLSQARVIVTCRVNVWQSNPRIISGFQTYRMLDFRLCQIEEFIQKWFASDPDAGRHLFQSLNQSGKERIRDLVRNPLRLTMLCSTWYLRERKLPNTRSDLYQQFVDDLYQWKCDQFHTTKQQRQKLNKKLGELARAAIDNELTRFLLRQELVCEKLGDSENPESMLTLALDLGWLNKIGVSAKNPREPVYAFFHATLQEYFAASSIDSWDFFLSKAYEHHPACIDDSGAYKAYRIFEPQWKEVILLWLGRTDIKEKDKHDFLNTLINFDDGCRGFYSYKAFFLAGVGISEVPSFPKSRYISKQLIQYAFGRPSQRSERWLPYLLPIQRQARIALLSSGDSLVIQALCEFTEYANAPKVLYEAADLLGKADFGNAHAITTLENLLTTVEEEDYLRLRVLDSLLQLSFDKSKVENELIRFIKMTRHEWRQLNAAQLLLRIDPTHPVAINALIKLLHTASEGLLAWNLNLEEIGFDSPRIMRALFKASYSGRNWDIRSSSIYSLATILVTDEKAVEKISTVFRFTKPLFNVFRIERFSFENGIDCLEYVVRLAEEVRSSESKGVRKKALLNLIGFTITHPEVALLSAKLSIGHDGSETRKKNLVSLFKQVNLAPGSIISVWEKLVDSMKDKRLQSLLAVAVADTGFDDEQVSSVLRRLLSSYNSDEERALFWTADALLRIDPRDENAIEVLTQLVRNSEERDYQSARALGRACNENGSLLDTMLYLFMNSETEALAGAITIGLQEVFRKDLLITVVGELSEFISEDSFKDRRYLRRNIFDVLSHCSYKLSYSEFYKAQSHLPTTEK